MSVNLLLKIIEACSTDEGIFVFLDETTKDVPIHLNPNMSAGELSDYICELTSSFAYISHYIASINHITSVFDEIIANHSSNARVSLSPTYGVKITKADKDDKIKSLLIKNINICGYQIKSTTMHQLIVHQVRVESLLGYYKSLLDTIEKSISVGITVLSFQKQELKNLGVG